MEGCTASTVTRRARLGGGAVLAVPAGREGRVGRVGRVGGRAVVALLVLVTVGSGCGLDGDTQADWCREATRSDAAFDVEVLHDEKALDAWRRLEADAPAEIRDDLRLVRASLLGWVADPETIPTEPDAIARVVDAVERIDRFLREDCGAPIPRPPRASTGSED